MAHSLALYVVENYHYGAAATVANNNVELWADLTVSQPENMEVFTYGVRETVKGIVDVIAAFEDFPDAENDNRYWD